MSRFTRTVNLYPTGTLIVGWTFRFRRVIMAPVWLNSRPTDALAVSPILGYRDAETGLHLLVKLIEAPGTVYTEAERFLSEVRAGVEAEQQAREQQRRVLQPYAAGHSTELKSIDSFRSDPKYGGNGTRIDMA
jgi:hypothetical protein